MGFVFFLLLWPAVLVLSVAALLIEVAGAVIASPAFPVLVGSLACALVATVLLVRLLWRRLHNREALNMGRELAVPAALLALSFVLFWVGVWLASSVLLALLEA